MRKTLSDQELNELRTSKRMSPAARLDWLAAALEFVNEVRSGAKKRNAKMPETASAGQAQGMVIRHNAPSREQPSTIACSSNSLGMVSK